MPLDVTPFLRPERAALLELLGGLSDDEWSRPTECPAWSVRGIALHVLGDDLSLLTRQRDASTDSLTLFAVDHPGLTFRGLLDGFNEHWVSAARFMSAPLLVDLLDVVGRWSAEFYETVGLDTVAREPVQFFATLDPSPYWQVIAREYSERFIHQSQIRRALGRSDLDGELVVTAACIHAHLLAAWARDFAPVAGATVELVVGGAGAWTLRRAGDAWSVQADGGTADATITVADDAVVRLVGRGLDAAELATVVSFSGDTDLARGLFEPIAPLLARPA
jgi:uncharacterized protein (TIGR03083 family)